MMSDAFILNKKKCCLYVWVLIWLFSFLGYDIFWLMIKNVFKRLIYSFKWCHTVYQMNFCLHPLMFALL